MTAQRVAIIGGGISGLSAAFALKQSMAEQRLDIECFVFEQDPDLGGKIRTHRESGLVVECGPDSILARKTAGIGLIRALGIESEVVNSNSASQKTFILHHGRLERLPPGTNMGIPMQIGPFARTPLLSWSAKSRALLDLVIPRSSQKEDQSLGRFLRRRLGNELVDNIAEPLLAGIFAGSVDDLSLAATFPQFAKMEAEHRSLILSSLANRKRQTTSAKSGRSAFITLRSGLQTLVERLYDCLQDDVHVECEATITNIVKTDDGRYTLSIEQQGRRRQLLADAVIVTTPAFAAAPLLQPLAPETDNLRAIPYVSTATVVLGYDSTRTPIALEGSGFVVPHLENRTITACTYVSSKWPHTTSGERVLIRCYVGRAGQERTLNQSDDEMVSAVRADLQSILGITAKPEFTRVTRWREAMPQYPVNHLRRVQSIEDALKTRTPGLFLAGAAYHGVGIPDCIDLSQKIAAHVVEFLHTT